MRKFKVVGAAVVLAIVASASHAADRWFHVKVDDQSGRGSEVELNLPLSLVETALRIIPEDVSRDASREMRLELNEAGFDVDALRELWAEVRDGQDATFLKVKDDEMNLEVSKEGSFFVARTVGDAKTKISVRFPLEVVDALFADPDRLDFAGAIRALSQYDGGDMVTVMDGDTSVRIWVDGTN